MRWKTFTNGCTRGQASHFERAAHAAAVHDGQGGFPGPARPGKHLRQRRAALERAREILGLPPLPSHDPLLEEKEKLDAARQELARALERAGKMLNEPAGIALKKS